VIYWREFLRFEFKQAQDLPPNGCIHIKMEDFISKTEEILRERCDFIDETRLDVTAPNVNYKFFY